MACRGRDLIDALKGSALDDRILAFAPHNAEQRFFAFADDHMISVGTRFVGQYACVHAAYHCCPAFAAGIVKMPVRVCYKRSSRGDTDNVRSEFFQLSMHLIARKFIKDNDLDAAAFKKSGKKTKAERLVVAELLAGTWIDKRDLFY